MVNCTCLCHCLLSFLYLCAAAVLHPRTHYAYGTSTTVMTDLRQAVEFIMDTNTCVADPQEVEHYRRKQGSFSEELVAKMACDNNTSLGKL
jgi:hypothetical protein